MNKETFDKISRTKGYQILENGIRQIEYIREIERDVCELVCKINSDNFFMMDKIEAMILEHLQLLFDDDHYIAYFIYDLDMGMEYVDGDVTDDKGELVNLSTLADLYVALMNQMGKDIEDDII
jgi:hypothetical protein